MSFARILLFSKFKYAPDVYDLLNSSVKTETTPPPLLAPESATSVLFVTLYSMLLFELISAFLIFVVVLVSSSV